MEKVSSPLQRLNLASNLRDYKRTNNLYKQQLTAQSPLLKSLKADEVMFKGDEPQKIDIKKAIELLRKGAGSFHLVDGSWKFIDGNGKILSATEDLQAALDADELLGAAAQAAAEELAGEGVKEAALGITEIVVGSLTACTIQ